MNDYKLRIVREALMNSKPRQMHPTQIDRHCEALRYVNEMLEPNENMDRRWDKAIFSGAEVRQAEAIRQAERWGGRTSGPAMEITAEQESWAPVWWILLLIGLGIGACIAIH